MGVPAFYRWLSQKYPKIVRDVIEDHPELVNEEWVQVDTSTPNPNGIEFDNLYLDMNGIIHPCFHPEDRPAPTTETEVFINIFDYIDRLFSIIRPRKVLYMAIDGVAPRAKMNQQRSRRFRAAQDQEEKEKEEMRLRADLEAQGIKVPKAAKSELHDSNTITPGTVFMDRLAVALQYYVHQRLNGDAGWRGIEVILSDSNTPGEGEHKAMQYVRQMRGRPGWNANTKHVVYGLDADLIMLALSTHEPHFFILREIITMTSPQDQAAATRAAFTSRNEEAPAAGSVAALKAKQELVVRKPEIARKPFQLLLISVLREYLALEMKVETSFEWDQERIYDDFVFMCFFVGNDFLPHMPTLDIREGAIELMMRIYKQNLPKLGGYLTNGADIDLARTEMFIQEIGKFEDAIFQKRMRDLRRQKDKLTRQKQQREQDKMRRNAAGQKTRNDESAPSAAFFAQQMAAGGVRSARDTARPALTFKGEALPSAHTAAGMTAAIEAEEAAVAAAAALPGPLPQPAQDQTEAEPQALPLPPAVPDNKSAAAALRARMAGSKKGRESEEPSTEATAAAEGGSPATKKLRPEGAADVSTSTEDAQAAAQATEPAVEPEQLVQPQQEVAAGDTEMPSALDATVAEAASGNGNGKGVEEVDQAEDDEAEALIKAEPELILQLVLEELQQLTPEQLEAGKKAAAKIKEELEQMVKDRSDKFDTMFSDETEKIRLDEAGWKSRYYQEKFGVPADQQVEVVRNIVKEYVQGLAWVMAYYYKGCASWNWFYPFHYAPFASDLVDLATCEVKFDPGEPFAPFNQLMGVFPAASSHALPQCFRHLFTAADSPILDFYPKEFAVDMNGKRFAWQGVAMLPFIDQDRLLSATTACLGGLSDEERRRNSTRLALLYVGASHPLAPSIYELAEKYGHLENEEERATQAVAEIPGEKGKGMFGYMLLGQGEVCPPAIPVCFGLGEDITGNQVLCVNYKLPDEIHHLSAVLEGCELDPPVLTELDKPYEEPLWHEGARGGRRNQGHDMRYPNPNDNRNGPAQRTIMHHTGQGGGRGGGGYDSRDNRSGPPSSQYDRYASSQQHGQGQYSAQQYGYPQSGGGRGGQYGGRGEQHGGRGEQQGGRGDPRRDNGGGGAPYGRDPRAGGGYGGGPPPAAGGYAAYGAPAHRGGAPPPAYGGYGAPPAAGGYGGGYGSQPQSSGYGGPPAATGYGAPSGSGRGASLYTSMRPPPPGGARYGAPPASGYGAAPAPGGYGASGGYGGPSAPGGYGQMVPGAHPAAPYGAPPPAYGSPAYGAAPPAYGAAPPAGNNPYSALQRQQQQQQHGWQR